jgi:hypothetical protein
MLVAAPPRWEIRGQKAWLSPGEKQQEAMGD